MSQYNKAKGYDTGVIGEADFLKYAASRGWSTFKGFHGHEPYDYILDDGDMLHRVEVKRIESLQFTQKNYYYMTVTKFDAKRFDFMFISTPQGCYMIPSSECPKDTLSIKQQGARSDYERNITAPGKYEVWRVFAD